MPKIFLIVAFVLGFQAHAAATTYLDSLKQAYSSSETDSMRVVNLLLIAEYHLSSSKEDARSYAQEALNLSVDNQYHYGAGKSFNQLGLIEYYEGNFSTSRDYFMKALDAFKKEVNIKGIASSYNNAGVTYYEQGRLELALDYYLTALEYRRDIQDTLDIALSLNNIANVYKDFGNAEQSLVYYHQSINYNKSIDNEAGLAMTYNNIGQIHAMQNTTDSAMYYYNLSMVMKNELNDEYGIVQTLANQGALYESMGQFAEALTHYKAAIAMSETIGDKYNIAITKVHIASLYQKQEEFEKSNAVAFEAIEQAQLIDATVQIRDGYRIVAQNYESMGNAELALQTYKQYTLFKDSLSNLASSRMVEELNAQFNLTEKDREIEALSSHVEEIELLADEAEKSGSNYILYSILLFVLLIVVLFLILRKQKLSEVQVLDDSNLINISTIRKLYAITVLLYPFIGFLYSHYIDDVNEAIGERLLISGSIAVVFLLNYFFNSFKKSIGVVTIVLYYVLTFHLISLVFRNDFNYVYVFSLLVLQIALVIIVRNVKQAIIYIVFSLGLTGVAFWYSGLLVSDYAVIFILLFSGSLISLVVTQAKDNVTKQLTFSHRIIKELEVLIFVANDRGKHTYVGPGIKKILGFSPADVLKVGWWKLMGVPEVKAIELEDEMAAVAKGEQQPADYSYNKVTDSKGEEKWVQWRDRRIDGNVLLGVGIDVTERMRQEEAVRGLMKRLRIVHSIDKSVLRADSAEEIIKSTLSELFKQLNLSSVSISLYNDLDKTGVSWRIRPNSGAVVEQVEGKVDGSDLKDFMKSGAPKIKVVQELEKANTYLQAEFECWKLGAGSSMVCPLTARNTIIALLTVAYEESNAISLEELELIEEVSDGLSGALEQSLLRKELKNSNDLLLATNKGINDSIVYAKRIQNAFQPTDNNLNEFLSESFVIHQPRDIVSGDFYWYVEHRNKVYVAVADCTGHGVSGAFLTLVGMNHLNHIVLDRNLVDPAAILMELDKVLKQTLRTEQKAEEGILVSTDGMDLGLCVYDIDTQVLRFSGARRPIYHFSEGEIVEIKSVKRSIGEDLHELTPDFITHTLEFGSNDSFYIFSDGLPDQFGEETGRKMGSLRVKELIKKHAYFPFEMQEKFYSEYFKNWKGATKQTDDMLFLGLKFHKNTSDQ